MNKPTLLRLSLLLSLLYASVAPAKIGIIVNRDLFPSVSAAITTYINDLAAIDGKQMWLNATSFTSTSSAAALRDSLRTHYTTDGLEGAVFVGNLPIATFEIENEAGLGYTEFPCDLYFMDLDGL